MPLWRRCSVPRVLLSFIIRYSTNIVGHHTRYRTMFYTDHIKIANTNSNIDLRVSTMMRDTFLISNVHKIQPGQDTMQCYIWSWRFGVFLHWIFFYISILEFFLHRYSVTFGVGGWGGYCADWGGSTPSLLMLSILTVGNSSTKQKQNIRIHNHKCKIYCEYSCTAFLGQCECFLSKAGLHMSKKFEYCKDCFSDNYTFSMFCDHYNAD